MPQFECILHVTHFSSLSFLFSLWFFSLFIIVWLKWRNQNGESSPRKKSVVDWIWWWCWRKTKTTPCGIGGKNAKTSAVGEKERNMKKISLHECILSDLCWFQQFYLYIFLSINRLFWHKNIDRNWEALSRLLIAAQVFSSCFIIIFYFGLCLFIYESVLYTSPQTFCNFASSSHWCCFPLSFIRSLDSISKQAAFIFAFKANMLNVMWIMGDVKIYLCLLELMYLRGDEQWHVTVRPFSTEIL